MKQIKNIYQFIKKEGKQNLLSSLELASFNSKSRRTFLIAKSVSSQFSITNAEYKIDNISKMKIRKIVNFGSKSISKHCASFGMKNFKLL